MNALKSIKWNSLLNTLIFFILGLLLLIFPIESLSIGGYLLASIFMLVGIGSFIRIIQNKGIETTADIFYIIFGIALIAVSISIFVDPTWIIRLINVFVGIILLLYSIMNFMNLLKYRKNRNTFWWIYLSLVIIIFILGILVILNPLFLAEIMTRLEGATLCVNSIITIILARKINKYLLDNNTTVTDIVKEE